MPRGVSVDQRVVPAIGVQVQAERVAPIAQIRVLLREPGDLSVVVTRVEVMQPAHAVVGVAGA